MDSSLLEGELSIILIQWVPFVGEKLTCRMEPENVMVKYAVAVINNDTVVGHLMKGESGKFAKTISYFLRLVELNSCTGVVTGRAVNKKAGRLREGYTNSMQSDIKREQVSLKNFRNLFNTCNIDIRCIFIFKIKSIC